MILLWKAVVLEVGVQWVQAHPQKFWFAENVGKIPENPGINGAQGLQKNTWTFIGGHTKKRPNYLCGRKFVGKSCTNNDSVKFGEIREKNFAPPALTPMIKRHPRPRCPSFESHYQFDWVCAVHLA